jgi:hypothetical protein
MWTPVGCVAAVEIPEQMRPECLPARLDEVRREVVSEDAKALFLNFADLRVNGLDAHTLRKRLLHAAEAVMREV